MVTLIFRECRLSGKKTGVCPVCKRKATRSKSFFQTVNLLNKNADGSVKTENEIYNEISKRLKDWQNDGGPVYHAKCEGE